MMAVQRPSFFRTLLRLVRIGQDQLAVFRTEGSHISGFLIRRGAKSGWRSRFPLMEKMPEIPSMEQIVQWLYTLRSLIEEGALWLVELAIALADAITSDHLEGAAIMAAILLGPSFALGLIGGFWRGLRMEWRQYRGLPRVVDGDTLEIRGERIRLFGIDAPELGQPWWDDDGREQDAGLSAKEALSDLVEGKRLAVNVLREDQYQRTIAIVKVDGRDIARSLVKEGLAFASPGSNRYRRTEKSARRRRRGFWRGDVMMPWDFRKAA